MKSRTIVLSLLAMLVLMASLVFQVTPSQAAPGTYFTTTDNEDDAGSGSPDNDMDVVVGNGTTIEFNIVVPVGGLPTTEAILAIYAEDVDEEQGQLDRVSLNGTVLGYLSGTNNTWSTTPFVLPAGLLVEGNNLVQIVVDTTNGGWVVTVDWGQIVVDGGIGTPGRINSITVTGFTDVGGTITLNADVEVEALADATFDLETNLYDSAGNSPDADLQAGFAMTAGQIVTRPVQFVFPAGANGEVYTIRGFLFDATGLLNSTKSTTWTYTSVPAPTITGVTPNAGPTAGGTSVTITGTDLTGGTFTFGGTTATCTVTPDGLSATCTTPAHAAGLVDVAVTTLGGTDTETGAFTFVPPPTVTGGTFGTGVAPRLGILAGGTSVTVTGTGFTGLGTGDATFTFGGLAATCTVNSDTSATCTTPAGVAGGLVHVAATTPYGGTGTVVGDFYYVELSPIIGPTAGGQTVTITGVGFTGATVYFNGLYSARAACTATTDFLLTCVTPARPQGPTDVVITTPADGNIFLLDGYTYVPAPSFDCCGNGIAPNTGSPLGGETVLINGHNLTGGTFTFGGVAAVCTVNPEGTQASCITPAHAPGLVDVVVTTIGGTAHIGFTYGPYMYYLPLVDLVGDSEP